VARVVEDPSKACRFLAFAVLAFAVAFTFALLSFIFLCLYLCPCPFLCLSQKEENDARLQVNLFLSVGVS
jgi:hypothetical protein